MSLTPAQTLKRYLERNSLDFRSFAELAGIHHTRVFRYTKGESIPSVAHAVAMEKASGGVIKAMSWAKAKRVAS